MTRQQAIEELSASLTKAIDDWAQAACGGKHEEAWEALGYTGLDTFRLMAKAAMAVLEAGADVQDYLKQNDLMM